MKIRTDFVANSSSSSFVLARKGALNEKQKAAVIAYIEENLLGRRVESMEQLQQFAEENGFREDSELFQESREYLEKGYVISGDTIDFECMFGEEYVCVLENIWRILEENGEGNFVGVDTDLSY